MLRRLRLPSDGLFWAVSLGHAANDMFMSIRAVLFAFISAYILPMTSSEIGLGISLIELSGALSQPFFGWLADKTGGRRLGTVGVAWTVSLLLAGVAVVSLGGSYWLMLIPMVIAGFGSGAFHPVGSMHATEVDLLHAGRNAAIFFLFGQLGLALGPALVGLLLNNAHTNLNRFFGSVLPPTLGHLLPEHGTIWPVFILILLAIPGVVMMARTLPNRNSYLQSGHTRLKPAAADVKGQPLPWKTFAILALAVALRSTVSLGAVTFMPLIFQLKGWSPAEYGLITSSFWVASGIMGVWFGHLGDHHDSRRVIMWSLVLAAPCIFLLPSWDGIGAFALAMGIGAMGGTHTLIVVQSQRYLPGRKAFASGAILGFIFATGALGNLVLGALIDRIGIVSAFQVAALVTLAGSVVWLFLPAEQRPVSVSEFIETQPIVAAVD